MKNNTQYDVYGNAHNAIETIDDGGSTLIFRLDDGMWMTRQKVMGLGKLWDTETMAIQHRAFIENATVEHCKVWGSE
jgi:hypothetical protein